jgi:sugar O-acyltransferase (sialic acid O-acetyltransferase NeuD family)
MDKNGSKVVLVGDGEFAEIAYQYLTHDSPHRVVAFSAEKNYIKREQLFGLPVVPFEEVERHYPPDEHQALVAITYTKLNRVRARLYRDVKSKRYSCISYVSSRAFVWHDVAVGDNCFIFENNVIQYQARIGNNVILWSGNHIGHRSVINDHCFISSHVVVSGYCEIGESCFVGVNCAIGNNVTIGRNCVLGAGAVVVKNTEPGQVYKGERNAEARTSSFALFRLTEDAA